VKKAIVIGLLCVMQTQGEEVLNGTQLKSLIREMLTTVNKTWYDACRVIANKDVANNYLCDFTNRSVTATIKTFK
jgi:hypothetical protein